jgi:hydroxyacylglutathione hydrolase
VVDPGQSDPVLDTLKRHNLKLVSILLTHHHQDHVGGVSELVTQTGARVFGPASEVLPRCDRPMQEGDSIDDPLLGFTLGVLDVPGHTAGHIAYSGEFNGAPVLFCGDTLFAAGCGRLFEGTPAQMDHSLGKLAALPPETRVYCAHEYTLSNMRWARAVEPGNQALERWQAQAQQARNQDQPTLPSSIAQELACNPFMRVRQPTVAQAAAQWAQCTLATPTEVFAALREWKNNFR